MSQSGKTRLADLPPSSITLGLISSAQAARILRAVIGPPVKLILRIFLCRTIASPASAVPGKIERTPSGRPACLHNCAKSSGAKGVISAGLQITQLPAASAAQTFIPSEISGPFHVMMIPTMPIGSGMVYDSSPRVSKVLMSSPESLSHQPA